MIERPHRPGPRNDRPGGFTPRPGFVPRGDQPRRPFGPPPAHAEPAHSVRLRDGDREVEVHGSAAFVRQALEDLPVLMARLRGEKPPRPSSISMPPAPSEPVSTGNGLPSHPGDGTEEPAEAGAHAGRGPRHQGDGRESGTPRRDAGTAPAATGATGGEALESEVLSVVRRSRTPIGIAEIRRRLGTAVTGQQVRRILERNADSVVSTGGRPAAYRARQ